MHTSNKVGKTCMYKSPFKINLNVKIHFCHCCELPTAQNMKNIFGSQLSMTVLTSQDTKALS